MYEGLGGIPRQFNGGHVFNMHEGQGYKKKGQGDEALQLPLFNAQSSQLKNTRWSSRQDFG